MNEQNKLIARKVKEKMAKVIARSRYELGDYVDPGVKCTLEEGMTKQAFKDECDINKILERYQTTGQLPDMIKQNPVYGDFAAVPTYEQALNVVSLAQEQFLALDAHIRARFQNDPSKFLEFATDMKNMDEMVKMGLAVAKVQSQDAATVENSKGASDVSTEGSKK